MKLRQHGVLGEFADPACVRAAVNALAQADQHAIEVYSPAPLESPDLVGSTIPGALPRTALLMAIVFAVSGYALEYYAAVIDYPLNVGGRPFDSSIAFVPAALELGILGAALGLVATFFRVTGLPRFYRPLFGVRGFARASRDRYFVLVRVALDSDEARHASRILSSAQAVSVSEVDDA